MEPNTSQGTEGSVKTCTRCGGILVNFTANLLPVEEFWKSVQIWQNYGHEFRVQFVAHPITGCAVAPALY